MLSRTPQPDHQIFLAGIRPENGDIAVRKTESVVLISMSSWKIERDSALRDSPPACAWTALAHNSAAAMNPNERSSI
jgi:hypothetical protein